MARLTIPDELRVLLAKLPGETALYDAAGIFLGLFKPGKVVEDEMYEEAIKSFDLKEADRRLQEFLASGEKGYTIEEIIEELEAEQRERGSSPQQAALKPTPPERPDHCP